MIFLLFIIAAGCGAMLRHGVNQFGIGWVGTLILNVAGAFALAWLLASEPAEATARVFGAGVLGSMTTFSMFSFEATEGTLAHRFTVVSSTLVLGLFAAAAGFALG